MNQQLTLEAENLHKSFDGPVPVEVLKGVSLQVKPGETLAIMGKSGEGKSTLLQIIGTLDTPSKGTIRICGKIPKKNKMATLRNEHIGFIFQSYHLLDDFTALDNVLMPLKIARKDTRCSQKLGLKLLKDVGLEGKEKTLAKYLSGGEKQRVAIARALCNQPDLLLADEPTGNLDRSHALEVQTLLLNAAKKWGKTLILVTHDEEFARQCDRVLLLKEGHLYSHANAQSTT